MLAYTKRHPLALHLAFVLLLGVPVLVAGCDNSVDILDRDTGLYSVYGALDINAEINSIRVKNLNTPLVDDSTRTLDATVTLENRRTGTSQVLKDSIVQFENVYTHNFRTTMPINPDTKYRLTVKHPDGRTAQATATTPPLAETNVNPRGKACETPIRIAFEPVASPKNLEPEIGFEIDGQRRWTPAFRPRSNESNADLVFVQFTPKQLLDAVFKPDSPLGGQEVWCHELDSNTLFVRYTHLGPDFSGDTPSDSLNVPGGLGQFGGYYEDSFTFKIDTMNVCAPFC